MVRPMKPARVYSICGLGEKISMVHSFPLSQEKSSRYLSFLFVLISSIRSITFKGLQITIMGHYINRVTFESTKSSPYRTHKITSQGGRNKLNHQKLLVTSIPCHLSAVILTYHASYMSCPCCVLTQLRPIRNRQL